MNKILTCQNISCWGSYDHFFRELLHGICWESIMTSLTAKKDAGNISGNIWKCTEIQNNVPNSESKVGSTFFVTSKYFGWVIPIGTIMWTEKHVTYLMEFSPPLSNVLSALEFWILSFLDEAVSSLCYVAPFIHVTTHKTACSGYRIERLELFDEFEEWHMIQVRIIVR